MTPERTPMTCPSITYRLKIVCLVLSLIFAAALLFPRGQRATTGRGMSRVMVTRDIPRLFFVLTPDEGRSEFFRRNEEEQVGNLKGVMRDFLKININLESPLAADWPFDTRRGRS